LAATFDKPKLLLIEDEKKTAIALKKGLEECNYSVDVAYDGLEGLSLVEKCSYKVIISDIILPKMNGVELCKIIREINPSVPILFLSALDSKNDIVLGLDAGADDYLTKPFDFRELLARIRSLIKRFNTSEILLYADIRINLKTKEVSRGGTNILLTAKEFKLLEYFVQNPNTVISRTDLAQNIWNLDFDSGTNVVEVYINYLRNKIDKPFPLKLIHNIHGVGYIMKDSGT
jgi:two-component system, OmpR family, copper resistance phosphate regulon response regulator CusR